MGYQASRELGEGDMRLRVTRLLSPIRSGSPIGEVRERCFTYVSCEKLTTGGGEPCASVSYPDWEVREHFQNRFYLNIGVQYDSCA